MMKTTALLLLSLTAAVLVDLCSSFSTTPHHYSTAHVGTQQRLSSFELHATRRQALHLLWGGVVATAAVEPAHATYSAYTRREEDWKIRQKEGAVTYSTSRDLRSQLRELVPANNESSKIFCPNGPTAAVSPLMENKCGDRLATPSVFGRTDDVLGNSIPGFAGGGLYSSGLANAAGGLPSYSSISGTGKVNQKLIGCHFGRE